MIITPHAFCKGNHAGANFQVSLQTYIIPAAPFMDHSKLLAETTDQSVSLLTTCCFPFMPHEYKL